MGKAKLIEFLKDIHSIYRSEKKLSNIYIEAINSVTSNIRGKVFRLNTKNELYLLLKLLSATKVNTVNLLSCFDLALEDLTPLITIPNSPIEEIISTCYFITVAPRPHTGDIKNSLFQLMNYLMKNLNNDNLKNTLLPRMIKIIHMMDVCYPDFVIHPKLREIVNARVQLLLAKMPPDSSKPHMDFSNHLKQRLRDLKINIEVKDEYPLDIVGTHLDIAIPSLKIAIEINGPSHYFQDGKMENNETLFKRELLTELGWEVIGVSVCEEMCSTKGVLDANKIDTFINTHILPLLNANKPKSPAELKDKVHKELYVVQGEFVEKDVALKYHEQRRLNRTTPKQQSLFFRGIVPLLRDRNTNEIEFPCLTYKQSEPSLQLQALIDDDIDLTQFDNEDYDSGSIDGREFLTASCDF